jgi:hypothetical protein
VSEAIKHGANAVSEAIKHGANAVSEAIKSGGYWSAHAEESITSQACLLLYGGA